MHNLKVVVSKIWTFFGTNIVIYRIIFYLTLCDPRIPVVQGIDFSTTYNVLHDITQPNFYVKDELCRECKQVEIVEHGLHSSCILRICLA